MTLYDQAYNYASVQGELTYINHDSYSSNILLNSYDTNQRITRFSNHSLSVPLYTPYETSMLLPSHDSWGEVYWQPNNWTQPMTGTVDYHPMPNTNSTLGRARSASSVTSHGYQDQVFYQDYNSYPKSILFSGIELPQFPIASTLYPDSINGFNQSPLTIYEHDTSSGERPNTQPFDLSLIFDQEEHKSGRKIPYSEKKCTCHCGKILLKKNLKNHEKTHLLNREKEFKCDKCCCSYHGKSDLTRHKIIKHSQRMNSVLL